MIPCQSCPRPRTSAAFLRGPLFQGRTPLQGLHFLHARTRTHTRTQAHTHARTDACMRTPCTRTHACGSSPGPPPGLWRGAAAEGAALGLSGGGCAPPRPLVPPGGPGARTTGCCTAPCWPRPWRGCWPWTWRTRGALPSVGWAPAPRSFMCDIKTGPHREVSVEGWCGVFVGGSARLEDRHGMAAYFSGRPASGMSLTPQELWPASLG